MYDNWKMKAIRSFSVPISKDAALQRVTAFLTQAGYKQMPDSGDYSHFKRGSIRGTLSDFNPTRWASAMNITVTSESNSSNINVEAKITNDPFEKRFVEELLTTEFNGLESAVTTSEFYSFDATDLRKRIAAYVNRVVGLFAGFVISIVLGIIAGMFALTRLAVSPLSASIIGAGVFVILVVICLLVWKRQKEH